MEDETPKNIINSKNTVFSKEHNFPVQGMFISYFGQDASISWESVELKDGFLEYFLNSDEWEVLSSMTFFEDDKNKIVYRMLNDEGRTIDDDFIKRTSMYLTLKNEEMGVIKLIFPSELDDEIKRSDRSSDDTSPTQIDMALFWNEKVRSFLNELIPNYFHYEEKSDKAKTNIIIKDENGSFTLKEFQIDYDDIDFENHYNDGLLEFDQKLTDRLSSTDKQSFFIIHGPWGTGKTSYLRYVMARVGHKRKVIYLPPSMVSALSDPSFVTFMTKHPDSILIVEDAESVVKKKVDERDEGTNSLLNITDGIMGNCLNLDIICTFNTDITKIDPALTRKGRLDGKFKLDLLEEHKANALRKKMGLVDAESDEDRRLGNILNPNEEKYSNKDEETKIGLKQ